VASVAPKTTARIEWSFVMRLSRSDAGVAEYRKAIRTVNAGTSSDAILQIVPIFNAWSTIADHRR